MRWVSRISFVVLSHLWTLAFAVDTPTRDEREIKSAEYVLVQARIISASTACSSGRSKDVAPCIYGDHSELALALIGNKTSRASLQSFAKLIRLQMDGALSEDYTCYALLKGQPLLTHWRKLDVNQVSAQCESEVQNKAQYSNPKLLGDVPNAAVCASLDSMKERIAELTKAIQLKKKCADGDF
jgi:hypothetical protein